MQTKSTYFMMCIVIVLSILFNCTTSETLAQKLTLQTLKSLRTYSTSSYDFIIIMKQLLMKNDDGHVIIDQSILPTQSSLYKSGIATSKHPLKIRYFYIYRDECASTKLLTSCQPGRNVPILAVYKRVIMEYEQGWGNKNQNMEINAKYIRNMRENVRQWVYDLIQAQLIIDPTDKQDIQDIVQQYKSVYIVVNNRTLAENQLAIELLAKDFTSQKFVYFTDYKKAQLLDLNLTEGTFQHLTYDGRHNHFPVVANPKFEHWKSFVLGELLWGIQPLSVQLTADRFNLTKLFQKDRQTIVFCDRSKQCIHFMKRLNQEIISKNGNPQIMRNIVQQTSVKNPKIMQLYYHVKIVQHSMPLVMVIDGQDSNFPNVPKRFIKQISLAQSPIQSIQQIWTNIDEQQYKSEYLSSGVPKKNGFFGKGSEKLIQKVTFETYKQAILDAHKKGAIYMMYVTAFDFQCAQCEENYAQLKKFASFLKSDDWNDVVFGVFDLSKNQIDLSSLPGIPSLMLMKPGSINPETMKDDPTDNKIIPFKGRFAFESLLKFIETHREIQEQQNKMQASTQQL